MDARLYRKNGIEGLIPKSPSGRPSFLSAKQKKRVKEFIVGKDPRQYGFDFGLWTRKFVSELILKKLGVKYSLKCIG